VKGAAVLCCRHIAAAALLALAAQSWADEAAVARDAPAKAQNAGDVRRVWVLSEPAGYAAANGAREIMVFDVFCEQGKLKQVSEGFEASSGPKFGEGWVVRTQAALTPAAAQQQLQKALADVCGI
jgi:hypothetical protein